MDVTVLVPGHYFCDIIFNGIPRFPSLGTELHTEAVTVVPGGVVNTVIGLHRLGVNVGWTGTLGNDFFSKYVDDYLQDMSIDLSLIDYPDRPMQRVTVALSYPEDRAFVTYVDPEPDIMELVEKSREKATFKYLHFPELRIDERMPDLIDSCHEAGIEVSMDCQHLETTVNNPLVQVILSKADLFMPNEVEVKRLTGEADLKVAVAQLRQWIDFIVVKDGENGAHLWRDDTYLHVPALPAGHIVDTTGAGDVFNAGFLAAFYQDKPLEECLRWGNIAGSLSLRGAGGCTTAPTLSELEGTSWKN